MPVKAWCVMNWLTALPLQAALNRWWRSEEGAIREVEERGCEACWPTARTLTPQALVEPFLRRPYFLRDMAGDFLIQESLCRTNF